MKISRLFRFQSGSARGNRREAIARWFAAEAGFRCHIDQRVLLTHRAFRLQSYRRRATRPPSLRIDDRFGYVVLAVIRRSSLQFTDEIHGQRIEAGALHIPAALISWGKSNTEAWLKHPFFNHQTIFETGNPRIDLLRPELRLYHQRKTSEINSKFGVFALLNTNFGAVNHFRAGGRRAKATLKSYDAAAFARQIGQSTLHKQDLLSAFLEAIPQIASDLYPHNLVIRPHPSENPQPWKDLGVSLPNVHVISDDLVVPWLISARCLIHNGCTSAVEAAVLGTTALAYCPPARGENSATLPNELSECFQNRTELTRRCLNLLEMPEKPSRSEWQNTILREHIASLDGPLASERIVEKLSLLTHDKKDKNSKLLAMMTSYANFLFRRSRNRLLSDRKNYEFHKCRAEEFTVPAISKRIELMRQALGRFDRIFLSQRAAGIVTISSGR